MGVRRISRSVCAPSLSLRPCGGGNDVAPHVEAGDSVYFTGTRTTVVSQNPKFASTRGTLRANVGIKGTLTTL